MDWAAMHRDAEEWYRRARRQQRERLLLLWWWLVAAIVPWAALVHGAGPFETVGDFESMALGQSAFAVPASAILLAAWGILKDVHWWLRAW